VIPGSNFNKNRDKMFFFAGFEYYYQRVDEGSTLSVVPTLKQRQGDFSELLTGPGANLNQGRTVTVPPGCRVGSAGPGSPAPNNNLAPCMDPMGKALIGLYPQPNYSDANNRFNYVYSVLRPIDRNQLVARVDYNISEDTKLYVRLGRESEEQAWPRGLWWNSSDYELPGKLTGNNLGRSLVVNVTSLINPTMTNEILFSGSKLKLDNDYKDAQRVTFEGLGVSRFGYFPGNNKYVPIGIIDAAGLGATS
jgi:hypothetical protein